MLLGRLLRFFAFPKAISATEVAQIEHLVDLASPKIRLASGYQQRLKPVVALALHQAEHMLQSMPEPLTLTKEQWRHDPLLTCAFANPERISEVITNHSHIQAWFAEHPLAQDAYMVLRMTRTLETRFGMEEQNGVIHQDVQQKILVFADHEFGPLVANQAELLHLARQRFLEELALHAARRIASLEQEKARIEDDITALRLTLRLNGFGQDAAGLQQKQLREQKLEKLQQTLNDIFMELEPDRLLEIVAKTFRRPQSQLRYTQTNLNIDSFGRVSAVDPAPASSKTITLHEIEFSGQETEVPTRKALIPVHILRSSLPPGEHGQDRKDALFSAPL